jgi:GT2 family glycosyltransferase
VHAVAHVVVASAVQTAGLVKNDTAHAQVTVVVVPRERFSETRRSLESIYDNTPLPVKLIYVDGGSPSSVRRYLAAQAERRSFHLIRSHRYLTPNQARNLALPHITTEYVVFVDNDVVVAPGWLDALVNCAEETGASIVGPMYYESEADTRKIHMAGGVARIEEHRGKRMLNESHRLAHGHFDGTTRFVREQVDLVEFHCMLVRMEVFNQFGPLDEKLLSALEHVDLCLGVRAAGGSVYFEPRAEITHLLPGPFALSDYPFFMLRWSDAWNAASIEHFQHKWGLDADDATLCALTVWLRKHRHLCFKPAWRVIYPVVGWRRTESIERAVTRGLASLAG